MPIAAAGRPTSFSQTRSRRECHPRTTTCLRVASIANIHWRHPAIVPQLMVVTAGSGYARGDDATTIRLTVGSAVVWTQGDEHETWTEEGMVLLIIETDDPNLGVRH